MLSLSLFSEGFFRARILFISSLFCDNFSLGVTIFHFDVLLFFKAFCRASFSLLILRVTFTKEEKKKERKKKKEEKILGHLTPSSFI